jgi:hypothetical protein
MCLLVLIVNFEQLEEDLYLKISEACSQQVHTAYTLRPFVLRDANAVVVTIS